MSLLRISRFLLILSLFPGLLIFPYPSFSAVDFSQKRDPDSDQSLALNYAIMMSAARRAISNRQAEINDPSKGDKEFIGDHIVMETTNQFNGLSNFSIDSLDRDSRLFLGLEMLLETINEVVTEALPRINKPGVAYKEFGPDEFTRAVAERFEKKNKGSAIIRLTAPYSNLRTFGGRPDKWEKYVIEKRLSAALHPQGHPVTEVTKYDGRPAVRLAYPEYYVGSCLSCHGTPKGQKDITGHKREGAKPNELAGIISVIVFPEGN